MDTQWFTHICPYRNENRLLADYFQLVLYNINLWALINKSYNKCLSRIRNVIESFYLKTNNIAIKDKQFYKQFVAFCSFLRRL